MISRTSTSMHTPRNGTKVLEKDVLPNKMFCLSGTSFPVDQVPKAIKAASPKNEAAGYGGIEDQADFIPEINNKIFE